MTANLWRASEAVKLSIQIAANYRRLLGRPLVEATPAMSDPQIAEALYELPWALLCHDGAQDPHFTYANRKAQSLFAMSWEQLVGMPSRLSAEADARDERAAMLDQAALHGYFSGYAGIRVASDGSRFRIWDATIWNVFDEASERVGQAALLPHSAPIGESVQV